MGNLEKERTTSPPNEARKPATVDLFVVCLFLLHWNLHTWHCRKTKIPFKGYFLSFGSGSIMKLRVYFDVFKGRVEC